MLSLTWGNPLPGRDEPHRRFVTSLVDARVKHICSGEPHLNHAADRMILTLSAPNCRIASTASGVIWYSKATVSADDNQCAWYPLFIPGQDWPYKTNDLAGGVDVPRTELGSQAITGQSVETKHWVKSMVLIVVIEIRSMLLPVGSEAGGIEV